MLGCQINSKYIKLDTQVVAISVDPKAPQDQSRSYNLYSRSRGKATVGAIVAPTGNMTTLLHQAKAAGYGAVYVTSDGCKVRRVVTCAATTLLFVLHVQAWLLLVHEGPTVSHIISICRTPNRYDALPSYWAAERKALV